MISALFATLGAAPWKAAGLLLFVASLGVIWLWIGQLRSENAELRAERLRLHHDVALHRALLAERDRVLQAFAEAQTQAEARRKASRVAKEEAIRAPKTEDGALAPVLRRALDRLR